MTAVTAVTITERPNVKPIRSMTYPLRDPNGKTGKRRVKPGAPFDPEDLSRRLNIHLEEQKIRAEKRREARAIKAIALQQKQQDGMYHHIPAVAATSFQRTATAEALGKVHKLSQPALKIHLEQAPFDDPTRTIDVTVLKKTVAKDQARIERDLLRNRNQFQWSRGMEEASTTDQERDLYKAPQRTFHPETSHVRIRHNVRAPRPFSEADTLSEDEDSLGHATLNTKPKAKPAVLDANDRNDWAQREHEVENRHGIKEWSNALLRKKESSRMIIAKNEKDAKACKDETAAGICESGSPPLSKGRGFLARFKRLGS